MLKPSTLLYLFLLVLFFFCTKKKKTSAFEPEPLPNVTINDERPACEKLPPAPEHFGWTDSLGDENRNVRAFLFNPVNANEVLCVVNGDIFNRNKLLCKNLVTGNIKNLATLGNFLPQVNKRGWIVFSDIHNFVYKIKTNGDSLTQLSFNVACSDPKWDYSGNFIYYLRSAVGNIPSQLIKIDLNGNIVETLIGDVPNNALFRNSNKIIYIKTSGNYCSLILKNMELVTNEITLVSGPIYSKPDQYYFDNLTLDQTDENIYWSNSIGIFKCNLSSLKTDTLLKNCENSIYSNPIVSFNPNEIYYTLHYKKALNSLVLLHEFKAMELNLVNQSSREVQIFPR